MPRLCQSRPVLTVFAGSVSSFQGRAGCFLSGATPALIDVAALVCLPVSVGKSIRLYLGDRTPGGLLTAEIMNWAGHVVAAPRSDLAALLKRPEAARTGIYLLLGDDPGSTGGSLVPYPERLFPEISGQLGREQLDETAHPAYGGEGASEHDSAEPFQWE
jgi:hypothetical protein